MILFMISSFQETRGRNFKFVPQHHQRSRQNEKNIDVIISFSPRYTEYGPIWVCMSPTSAL